jgi:hypothetical protein
MITRSIDNDNNGRQPSTVDGALATNYDVGCDMRIHVESTTQESACVIQIISRFGEKLKLANDAENQM